MWTAALEKADVRTTAATQHYLGTASRLIYSFTFPDAIFLFPLTDFKGRGFVFTLALAVQIFISTVLLWKYKGVSKTEIYIKHM
jgi:hypothetical protein